MTTTICGLLFLHLFIGPDCVVYVVKNTYYGYTSTVVCTTSLADLPYAAISKQMLKKIVNKQAGHGDAVVL